MALGAHAREKTILALNAPASNEEKDAHPPDFFVFT